MDGLSSISFELKIPSMYVFDFVITLAGAFSIVLKLET